MLVDLSFIFFKNSLIFGYLRTLSIKQWTFKTVLKHRILSTVCWEILDSSSKLFYLCINLKGNMQEIFIRNNIYNSYIIIHKTYNIVEYTMIVEKFLDVLCYFSLQNSSIADNVLQLHLMITIIVFSTIFFSLKSNIILCVHGVFFLDIL